MEGVVNRFHANKQERMYERIDALNTFTLFATLFPLLLVGCSTSVGEKRTVATRDGKVIIVTDLSIVGARLLIDDESGSFELQTSVGTIHVPRDLRGIKSVDVLQAGVCAIELRDRANKIAREQAVARHEAELAIILRYGAKISKTDVENRLCEIQKRRHALEEELRSLSTRYRFRITYDSGKTTEGQTESVGLLGWGYLKGLARDAADQEARFKIPMTEVVGITKE